MDEETKDLMVNEIRAAIQKQVNGKIDTLGQMMEEHVKVCLPAIEQRNEDMARMMPVVLAFEEGQRDLKSAKKGGKAILWLAATITAIGSAYLIIRNIFWS